MCPAPSASSTRARSSSALRMPAPADTLSIPSGRRASSAERSSTQASGFSTLTMNVTGPETSTARVSARSSTTAFGTSSPNVTLRYVTTENAIRKPSQCGTFSPSSSRTTGSPTAPIRMATALMPT